MRHEDVGLLVTEVDFSKFSDRNQEEETELILLL